MVYQVNLIKKQTIEKAFSNNPKIKHKGTLDYQ